MKIVIKNSSLVFKAKADFHPLTLENGSCNVTNGSISVDADQSAPTASSRYIVEGAPYLDIENNALEIITNAASPLVVLFYYNASKQFIAMCGTSIYATQAMVSGVPFDVLNGVQQFNNNGNEVTAEYVRENAKYWRVVVRDPIVTDGKSVQLLMP